MPFSSFRATGVSSPRGAFDSQERRFLLGPHQLEILSADAISTPGAYTVASGVVLTGISDNVLDTALDQVFTQPEILRCRLDFDEALNVVAFRSTNTLSVKRLSAQTAATDDAISRLGVELLRDQRSRVCDPFASADALHHLVVQPIELNGRVTAHLVAFTTHHVFIDEYSVALLWHRVVAAATDPDAAIRDHPFSRWLASQADSLVEADLARRQGETHTHGVAEFAQPTNASPGTPVEAVRTLDSAVSRDLMVASRLYGASPGAILSGSLANAIAGTSKGACLLNMPMSLRHAIEDLNMVGCAVTNTQVVMNAQPRFDEDALSEWQESLQYAADRARSIFSRVRAGEPELPSERRTAPVASIALETPSRGQVRSVRYSIIAPPRGALKFPLMCFATTASDVTAPQLHVLVDSNRLPNVSPNQIIDDAVGFVNDLCSTAAGFKQ